MRSGRSVVAALEIGTARAQPGQISYGSFEAVGLPTGGSDSFPVIIAQGTEAGPVLWLTASIHGAEYTGISVIHRLLTPELVAGLRGTIVAIPTLNPAGLRTASRTAYYQSNQDPNRLFPAASIRPAPPPDAPPPPLELAYKRLYDQIAATADCLIDLHNFSLGSLPFAFRDPVFYRDGRDRVLAGQLQDRLMQMLAAFGHTVINEYVLNDYLKKGLHRSVSGAALNHARIPAFTVELGGYLTVDPVIVAACLSGIRNVLRWAAMLSDAPEAIAGVNVLSPGYPIRRILHPYTPDSGIIAYQVSAGESVTVGDRVARLTDIYGRPLGANDGWIVTEYDGYVLGLSSGAACYQHDPLLSLAVRDDSELLLPFPG